MSEEAKAMVPTLSYDVKLLFAVLFLVGIGIVMVYSASSALALEKFGSDAYFLKKQALFSLFGIVALVIFSHIPFRIYRSLTYPLLFTALALMLAVQFSGLGVSAGGSLRWLRLGPVTFQPVEVARLALVVFMAYSLNKKNDALQQFGIGFVPHVIVLVIFAVPLLLQPDFGSVVIFATLVWMMMFIAGVRYRHLLSVLILALPPTYFLMIHATYRVKRLLSFLDPWQYPANEGYQIIHSLMAFGTGGLWGAGIGKGYQKLFYLPEPHTDFIFSVIGEEFGFMGSITLLILWAIVLVLGMNIALRSRNLFGGLAAAGFVSTLFFYVVINIGMVIGLLPVVGIPLPLISYGGTVMMTVMIGFGFLMAVHLNRDNQMAIRGVF